MDVLSEVLEMNQKYGTNGNFVWMGDLNASFHRPTPYANDKQIKTFCIEIKFTAYNMVEKSPTYFHITRNITSRIDHLLTHHRSKEIHQHVYDVTRHLLNLGSYDPVLAIISVNLSPCKTERHYPATTKAWKRPNWKKGDIQAYKKESKLHLDRFIP